MKRTVFDLMKQKNLSQLHLISDIASITDALNLLQKDDVGALLVMNIEQVVGVFSERDIARAYALHNGFLNPNTKVRELMSKNIIYVTPDYRLDECMSVMVKHRIRHLPILQGEIPIGFLSMRHIMEALVEENQFMVNQLTSYITGTTVNEANTVRPGLVKSKLNARDEVLFSEI